MKNVLMTFFMTLLMLAMFSVGGAAERAGPQSPLQIDTLEYPTAFFTDSGTNSDQDLVLSSIPAAVLVRDHVAIRSTASAATVKQHAAAACDSLVVWSYGFNQETGISGLIERTGNYPPITTNLVLEVDNPISFRLPATVPPR